MESLRDLDFDDLIVLHLLGKTDLTVTDIARAMSLSQPSISQRLGKISKAFVMTENLLQKKGRTVTLTNEGRQIAKRASAAIKALQG
jgi:Mn-dependent DtxR family transcriptional regulator